jgi:hypothetical protein
MPARSATRTAAAAAARHRCTAHATGGLGGQAGRGEDGEQPPRTHVPVGTARRRVGIGHGSALVEDGVTRRTAELVNRHVVDLRCGSLCERTGCDEFVAAGTPPRPAPASERPCADATKPRTTHISKCPRLECRQMNSGRVRWARTPGQAAVGGGRWRSSPACSRWLRRRLWKPQSRRPLS